MKNTLLTFVGLVIAGFFIKHLTTSNEPSVSRAKSVNDKSPVIYEETPEDTTKDKIIPTRENRNNIIIKTSTIEDNQKQKSKTKISSKPSIIRREVVVASGNAIVTPSKINILSNEPPSATSTIRKPVTLVSNELPLNITTAVNNTQTPSLTNSLSIQTSSDENSDERNSESNIFGSLLQGISSVAAYLGSNIVMNTKYPDRGFYGSFSLLYYDEEIKTINTRSQKDFIQEYKLGYMGNIYNPNLLDYTLEGLLRFEKLKDEVGDSTTTSKSDSQDYKLNFKFLKKTKFPFTIYANRNEKPVKRFYTGYTYDYLLKSKGSGINGSILFNPFTLRYGASKHDTSSESFEYLQKRKISKYNISLKRSEKSYSYGIGYKHLNENINKTYTDINNTTINNETSKIDDSIKMYYRLNISKELKLNTSANYIETDYISSQAKNTNANLDLRWRPNSKLSASVAISGARLDSIYDLNTTDNITNRFDTLNISENFNYKISPTINITQSASSYTYESNSVSGDIKHFRIDASHQYKNIISKERLLTINTSISTQRTDSELLTKDTNSSKTSTSIDRYYFNSKLTLTDQLPSLDSKAKFSAGYRNMQTSTDEATVQYTSSLSLLSNVAKLFRNRLSASIAQYNKTAINSTFDDSSTTTINISEMLDFSFRLGIKGNMTFRTGVSYSDTRYNNSSITRVRPLANLSLKYRVRQNLLFSAGFNANNDLTYDTTNYSGDSSLTYHIGKTSFLMSYKYNKTDYANNQERYDYERNRFDARLVRKF